MVYDYCSRGAETVSKQLCNLLVEIEVRLDRGESVVLSEEMFLVWQDGASFWQKLERLSQLLAGLRHTYLITMRSPAEALVSYYQELYAGLSVKERLRPGLFFGSARCDCYDYGKLTSWFEARGLTVRAVDFEIFKAGTFSLQSLLGPDCPLGLEITIPKANQGIKAQGGGRRVLPAVTLGEFTRDGVLLAAKDALRNTSPRAFAQMKRLAHMLVVRPQGERHLRIPTDRLAQLTDAYQVVRAKYINSKDGGAT